MPHVMRWPGLLPLSLAISALSLPAGADGGEQTPAKHALLVGVTYYPHLEKRFHLHGPANDVLLMRDLLVDQFGFQKQNVTILSEAEGKREADLLPTSAAIRREFQRLARIAQPGDQIVILMGGHGSQQPEPENPIDPEPDGLDEIFLPRDVKHWSDEAAQVPGAIIDDDFGAWLKAIQAKKAYVWIIFDACHSGSMIRGIKEQERQVQPEGDLKVPRAAIRKAQERAAQRFKEGTRGGPVGPSRAPLPKGGIVAFYACQETEVTVERELPDKSKDAKPYGLFTYTLVQALTHARQNGNRPPTYRELLQAVHSRYAAKGLQAPTPQMEGGQEDRNREVLGAASWAGRSSVLFTRGAKGCKISAGALHGITPGSVLAVRPLADRKDADKIAGYVRVQEIRMTTAVVTPTAFGAWKAVDKLPDEGRCELAYVDFGVDKLRIAIDPLGDAGKPLEEKQARAMSLALDEAAVKARAMLERVDKAESADWLVRQGMRGLFLVPASQYVSAASAGMDAGIFGPYALDAELPSTLADRFGRIARAENLRKLIGASAAEMTRGKAEGGVQIELVLRLFADASDRKGAPLPIDAGKVQLFHNDHVGMVVHNPNRFAIDVTVLYLDSGFGIDAYFPAPDKGELNRLKPGETLTIPTIQIDAGATFGLENLVVLAIKAGTKEPVDFSFLAQPTLEKSLASRGKAMGSEPVSALESLFESSLYGAGNTRGISRRVADEFVFRVVPWHLSPKTRSK